MHKHTAIKDYLRNESLLETRTIVHTATSDQIILTAPVCPEEKCINISELDLHDIERIRNEDPFMYHSIVQHIRKMRSYGFVSHLDSVDDELGSPDPSPADTAAGNPYPGATRRDAAFLNNNNNRGPPPQTSNAQSSRTAEHRILPFAHQRHPLFSSFQPVPSSFSSQSLSHFRQSFPGYSSSVVTRKHRISVEVDRREDIAKLIVSLSGHLGHPRSDATAMSESDNNSDNDSNGVDLSFLGL